jgi:hypothetical protein
MRGMVLPGVGGGIEYDDLFTSDVWNSILRIFQAFSMNGGILILNAESTHRVSSVSAGHYR